MHKLALSRVLFFVLGLLSALLFLKDPNVVFCKTPVVEDPNEGLLSHPITRKVESIVSLSTHFNNFNV
ncbi:hypothetical protein GLYMA_04G047700v4 [Glycine max]|uniref:Uncharacterized protein n=2 Tax=Glycine subgen. Soja TaxID=1462606 RepID=K7KI44_SOYBN|nr:hypothetical protein JHK85_009333 [Glycine max]KAG5065349.1 hypothetical protein JHK86_009080 [Glycine max]KAH1109802.1 hypothetical protein GYH30_008951 [Glycine max]KRH61447.1 hypothetical protein GLYMA_04G047700v4 [Glycine max]RZC15047.1 hypothetical protein D0Y65_008787 [Glycine soja]